MRLTAVSTFQPANDLKNKKIFESFKGFITNGSPPARKNVFFRALPELPLPNVVVGCGGGGGGGDVVVVVYCFVFDT